MTTPEALLQYAIQNFWWLILLSIWLQFLMADIYITVMYPNSQQKNLGFHKQTLPGNWLLRLLLDLCLIYSLPLHILRLTLRLPKNSLLSNVLDTVVFGLMLEVIVLTSLLFLVTATFFLLG